VKQKLFQKFLVILKILYCIFLTLRKQRFTKRPDADAVFFNAGLNMCFVLTLKKYLQQIRLIAFEKNAKTTHFNSEKRRHRSEG